MLEVKKTPGRVGLQQLSVNTVLSYLVHMIGDSLASSDHNFRKSKIPFKSPLSLCNSLAFTYPCCPVSNRKKVFGVERISLQNKN